MRLKQNPKLIGSNLHDCRTQVGACPLHCNQCYYNREGAFYCDINKTHIPSPRTVGHGIARMNAGHDSNYRRGEVIRQAKKYKHAFYNTSIPQFDFPGPVVFTANPKEEDVPTIIMAKELPSDEELKKIMFIRLRVSASNLDLVGDQISCWVRLDIPVVLTFMAYYEDNALQKVLEKVPEAQVYYEWKVRHVNSYYCPTKNFKKMVMKRMNRIGGRLVSMCGTFESNQCVDCKNCETFYWQTMKHLKGE